MTHQITYPRCKRIIANNPVIDQAAKREGRSVAGKDVYSAEIQDL